MSISGQTLQHAAAVHAYEFYSTQGKPVDRGRLGLAILGSPFTKEFKLIMYATKQQYVTQVPILPRFQLSVQGDQYASFYDENRKSWSVKFETQEASDEFARQLLVAKVNSAAKMEIALTQDLVTGNNEPANVNDEVECKYTLYLFADYKIGKVLESDVSVSLQLGKGTATKGLEAGIVGVKEGGHRLVCVPSALAYGRQGLGDVIPAHATLLYDIRVQKVTTAEKLAKAKAGALKAKKQNEGQDSVISSSPAVGSNSPKPSRQRTGDNASQTLVSSSPQSEETILTQELEGKPSPKTSKKKRSAKPVKVSTSLSLASDEAEDEKVESPVVEDKKPLTKPKPPKAIPHSAQPDDYTNDSMESAAKHSQKSAPVPIKPKPTVPKKRPLSMPDTENVIDYHNSKSPEPLPEKRDVASLKARLAQQTYMGRSPKQESHLENHPELPAVSSLSPKHRTTNVMRSNSAAAAHSKLDRNGVGAGSVPPQVVQHQNGPSLTKVAQLEKQAAKLNQQLQEQEQRHQNQLSLIKERYEKLKQMVREKDEEIENIKEQARAKVKEKQEEAQKEVERLTNEMQKQHSILNRKVSNLKAELSETDPGYVHIGTADLLRQGDIFMAGDELMFPEKPRRTGQGQWGDLQLASFRGCPILVELVNQITLTEYTRDAFEIEVSQAVKLRHPNIVQVLGVVLTANQPSLVTDIYEGTVRELLSKRSFDKNEVIRFACDLSKALNFLHLSKPPIYHGNISSSAVILQNDHQGFKAKLVHDGFVQFLAKTEPATVQKNKIYHPAGDAAMPADAVDCYSLGVLICEMSIRRLPLPDQRDKQISSISTRSTRELVQYCIVGDARGYRATMSNVIDMLRKILGK